MTRAWKKRLLRIWLGFSLLLLGALLVVWITPYQVPQDAGEKAKKYAEKFTEHAAVDALVASLPDVADAPGNQQKAREALQGTQLRQLCVYRFYDLIWQVELRGGSQTTCQKHINKDWLALFPFLYMGETQVADSNSRWTQEWIAELPQMASDTQRYGFAKLMVWLQEWHMPMLVHIVDGWGMVSILMLLGLLRLPLARAHPKLAGLAVLLLAYLLFMACFFMPHFVFDPIQRRSPYSSNAAPAPILGMQVCLFIVWYKTLMQGLQGKWWLEILLFVGWCVLAVLLFLGFVIGYCSVSMCF